MKYSPEQLKDIHAAIDAHNEGKLVEQLLGSVGGVWRPFDGQWCLGGRWLYRPKPEPKIRLWNCASDVPIGPCYIRSNRSDGLSWSMIVSAGTGELNAMGDAGVHRLRYEYLSDYEYSTDRREWKPCQVTEP